MVPGFSSKLIKVVYPLKFAAARLPKSTQALWALSQWSADLPARTETRSYLRLAYGISKLAQAYSLRT